MCGGGPFELAAGAWTDDTSMALCLAESLVIKSGFDARDQMTRYVNWWKWGYLSSTGNCFDIGMTVRAALQRFLDNGDPFAGSPDPRLAGNGSLMRLAPIPLFYYADSRSVVRYSGESSRTTHGCSEAIECCQLFGHFLHNALAGRDKEAVRNADGLSLNEAKVIAIAGGTFCSKSRDEVRGTGYCVDSLEAALWCFNSTSNFEDAVLEAVNLGDDADTTGAIVGQIAGAYYGVDGIPGHWIEKIRMRPEIEQLALSLLEASSRPTGRQPTA
jgi:ADP-ribosyl-[dinitrogen reductase] hydrolase